jgi:hypothetical protein
MYDFNASVIKINSIANQITCQKQYALTVEVEK